MSAGGRWEVQSPLDRARHLGYVRNAVRMKEEGTNLQKLPEARPKRASDAKLRGLNCTESNVRGGCGGRRLSDVSIEC